MPITSPRRAVACLFLLFGVACGGSDSTSPAPAAGSDPVFSVTDAQLKALVGARAGWTYYKKKADTLARSPVSGHSESRLRTQYNPTAAAMLDAGGKVRAGVTFPDSSIIVKELIDGSSLSTIAVMMKLAKSPQAGPSGWVWGYYRPNGDVRNSVDQRGGSCAGCHSSGIDYSRMNDSHP